MRRLHDKPCEKCGSNENYIFIDEDRHSLFCKNCCNYEDIYVGDELKAKWQAQEEEKARQESCKPKCPTCGSTDLKKITASKRVFKTALFGLAGAVDDAGKTYQCGKCKAKF